ncbi:unnamed protein product [Nezara viridula]|uniref:ASCH domain-containing protein n=1 Tax=Nezara viridula TaxID=85310 RepID=A0A9P0MNY4_NEZVI|nr:unnamed protein product [Nezara viridula]
MSDLTKWVISELSSLLHFPVTEDMAKCILMIESNRDLEDYMKTLVDYSNPAHQKFIKELLHRKTMTIQGYKKSELDNYIDPTEKKEKKKGKGKNENKKAQLDEQGKGEQGKKKTKYVNLYSSDDKGTVLLKGRHLCNCQASKHGLINNCLRCGRIVCEQEGSGPCLFCSRPVYSREELQKNPILAKQSQLDNSALETALQLRDRLLEYDKTSEARTRVIDDESDYFSTNSVWLTKEMKEELRKKEERLQELKHSRNRSLILDFTGRRLIDDDFRKLNMESLLLDEVTDMMDNLSSSYHQSSDNLDPRSLELEPIYDGGSNNLPQEKGSRWHNSMGRVQDRQVMEMTDNGACLSMHQPWATLLVEGIKVHEGRSWYTSHRGRLWIAATARVPTQEDIDDVLQPYQHLIGDKHLPRKYPTGCLLGCVNVVDCLAQEEYIQQYPDGMSDEPFVFICKDPVKSPVLFPIKGKHKIYKLDTNIHQAAVKCLQKLAKI